MGIEVREVTTRRQMKRFITFPLRLYDADSLYVPHLIVERKEFFSSENPAFEFTDPAYFLAFDSGRIVGRISAHVNARHNRHAGEKAGFFGFLESVQDFAVAAALLEKAEEWLRQRSMQVVRGPLNFSTNHECGMLVDGFDDPPAIMMPYNKTYYPSFMERAGYLKAKDLVAYDCLDEDGVPPFLERFAMRAAERYGLVCRPIDKRFFEEDVRTAFRIYNEAWSDNWGFVPMTEAQFRFAAKGLKQVLDPDLAFIAEADGEPVGFSLSLPDYNPLFKKMKGRLLPFGIFIFLLGRRRLERIRTLTLGVVPEFRRRGVESLLIYHTYTGGVKKGYHRGEFSWVLEDNVLLRRAVERIGARAYKTYRIYEKCL